ncbi:unnamed protein product, partial [Ixodes hexagonus]
PHAVPNLRHRSACQHQFPRPPCGEQPDLVRCSQAHVNARWFFFSNGTCAEWDFQDGDCVSATLTAFQTVQDCQRGCLEGRRHSMCGQLPVGQRCIEDQLHFPAYSRRDPGGRFRCEFVDLGEPRCLLGPNNFETLSACRASCLAS